ncbi:DEAD/DEAH box helicase family protein [Clostridium baratii]|uniref:DEAD/DEAH box helicase family protein n=1 Tax=Clostridium baratii TaxID=1561 RepID=UPI0030D4B892
MGYKELEVKDYYNNDEMNLIDEFYNPIIRKSKNYKRASGFFSSSSFWSFIEGLKDFINNENSKIFLLISPELSKDDVDAIILGEKARSKVIEDYFRIKLLEKNKYDDQYNLLAWLIYKEKLDIKIIIKRNLKENGIFHDKFGIMEDYNGNKVVFHGSLNESRMGIINNFEAIEVFKSWEFGDVSRINRIEQMFDNLWNDKSQNWQSIDIPKSIKEEIIKSRKVYKSKNTLEIPKKYVLRDYQKEAIQIWFKNKCRGILEMATGSGKTLTSIFAMIRLMEVIKKKGFPCGMLIVVPYKNLLEQWCEELEDFNIYPIRCYESKFIWKEVLFQEILNFNKYTDRELFIITTNATFITEEFQKLIKRIQRDYIFCADEVHHLSAPKISNMLPNNTNFKLGLTATLGNEFEEEKVERLENYFGGRIFNFGLKEAIENNCLTKYYYYPVFIELTDEEMGDYLELTYKIVKLMRVDEEAESLKALLNKRKRIIFNAKNKVEKFKSMVSELKKYKRSLVYCGDKIEDGNKYVNLINRIVYDSGIKTNTYTAELNKKERERVLEDFKKGKLEVLTAIKCLDEGVNIPSLDCAFILASNNDSKQFIQRRGRILRKYKGKEFAYIYDFIVIPTLDKNVLDVIESEVKRVQANIIKKELKRVKEFANLCENKIDVLIEISKVLLLYN